jgi:cytochrome c
MTKSGLIIVALAVGMTMPAGVAVAQDVAAGEKLFKRCAACHSLEAGKHRIGPSLHGVVGRAAGTAEAYKYSALNAAAGENGLVWSEDTIVPYLADPNVFLTGFLKEKGKPELAKGHSKMTFRMPKEQDRRDIAAFLAAQDR